MNSQKWSVRFFTVADYEEEEIWLREKHKSGWKLVKTFPPCFYVFESCVPEDVVYRLDYKNNTENRDYFQLFQDYGWECFNRYLGWLYFRKPVSETDTEQDAEIFSDDVSRMDMVDHIIKTRLLPLVVIFFCCVLPNLIRCISESDPLADFLTIVFALLFFLYLYVVLYCGLKLHKLRKKYNKRS